LDPGLRGPVLIWLRAKTNAKPHALEPCAQLEFQVAFLGPNPAAVPKPTGEANRCNLGHVTPKTLQKALYVGFSQIGRPLQVVCLGWSQFPIPYLCFVASTKSGVALYNDNR